MLLERSMLRYQRRMFRRQSAGEDLRIMVLEDDTQRRKIAPDTTLREPADLTGRLAAGALPICDGWKARGMVTDRGIIVRAVSVGKGAVVRDKRGVERTGSMALRGRRCG
jgi:hypothetical protein